jgi:hypothetical protein
MIDYVRSREALKKHPTRMTKDGQLFDFRWVVDKSGELKRSIHECSGATPVWGLSSSVGELPLIVKSKLLLISGLPEEGLVFYELCYRADSPSIK